MDEEPARKDLPSELSNSKDHALLPSIEFSLDHFISTHQSCSSNLLFMR
jgi:hypothetical protein